MEIEKPQETLEEREKKEGILANLDIYFHDSKILQASNL
jgi:hypothetical protein